MRLILEADSDDVIRLLGVYSLSAQQVPVELQHVVDAGLVRRWLGAILDRWDELDADDRHAYSALVAHMTNRIRVSTRDVL